MNWKIPLFKIFWKKDDIKAISKIIKRGQYWTTGPENEHFEKKIANYIGTKFAILFNSGTSALFAILSSLDVKDKEVIVPSFTFIATANSVVLAGGKPVFAESEKETLGLDINDVEKKITKNTKAIMALHYGGFPSKNIDALRNLADKKKIFLIEDAAGSLGSCIGTKKVGSFGHAAMFSFCQNKIITTGEGGVIVTDSEDLYEKLKLIRSHGRIEQNSEYFSNIQDNDYIKAGHNLRMSTISAALGLSQFNKIEKIINERRKIATYLDKHLSTIPHIKLLTKIKDHKQVYQMYSILLKDNQSRNNLQNFLEKKGIMNKIYFNPVHLKTIYQERFYCKKGDLPITEVLSDTILTLPIYVGMKKRELNMIISGIKEFFMKGG